MPVSESMVQEIVQQVMAKMQIADAPAEKQHGVFKDINDAIEAAKKSQEIVHKMSMDQREKIISCIRKKIKENAEIMARMGVEETKMGNVGDKILKHHLVADKTPGTEAITTTAWSGDRGLTLVEMGPFGVIGAITPCTNPSETVLCNTMGMLAGGNTVVFNPHPAQFCEKMLLIDILFQKVTLCQFHDQRFQRQSCSFRFCTDILDHIGLGCLNLGNINTHSKTWKYFPDLAAFSHSFSHHPAASRNNKTGFFQNRNKLCR